ncbi:hypothetical protein [Fischerella thermalis]|uniref:hypothetical protein n=1 Tax=Fischerella thermalis TaxID=372787 RepID=UPI000C7FAC73|nr:hypothetical protein [Fischerella thermalis]PLZ27210.1 hypothetical protein CBP29_04690 [Fischerella thermalis WC341]PLZ30618.1 hypothetical protein CBP10_12850 [Fischerella thermalis WC558]PLZ31800.1 hypothetical protein CBP27_20430 [Fischerella thermalis WC542]PLZ58748.1 hypothetical protein CBP15_03125 [Fischerella thermalis WC442]PLZ64233.1 hypothetical protein CBP24_00090 [Fischerella thermalis WC439]
MFDPRQTQINESYLGTADTAIQTSRELSKSLINVLTKITKVILEKLKEAQEASKIVVEVGKDIYNLVPDESTPGAYKWEKVDLTSKSIKSNQETNIVLMPDLLVEGQYTIETEPFTDYQAQIIAARLVEYVPNFNSDYQQTSDNTLKITAYLESDGSEKQIVIYEQNSEGKCTTNLVTEILTPDEIIDVASEPLVKLLSPSADIINNYKDTKELLFDDKKPDITEVTPPLDNLPVTLNEDNQQLNSAIVTTPVNLDYEEEEAVVGFLDDIDISNPPDFDSPPDVDYSQSPVVKNYPEAVEQTLSEQSKTNIQTVESNTSQQLLQDENSKNSSPINQEINLSVEIEVNNSIEADVVNNFQEEITQPEETIQIRRIVTSNHQSQNQADEEVNKNVTHNQFFPQQPEEQATNNRKKYAPEFTYQEVANSQDVEPAAQQWARQVEIPIYQINNKQAREERYNGENKDIAETATAMLKKYGTLEQDGSRIYHSDTFVIRQEGDTVSIHRRSDELFGWENSLMDFKLNKKEEPKITKKPTEMLPIERQEFLIVAEYLGDNGKLPDLNNADIRDVANSLGSLAPAGTIKTLEVFKQNEILHTLNNVLIQADKEELTVGEFTIKRTREPENNRASLQLFKTTEEKGTQELVRFDLTKTEAGITKEVSKMNISDYDINQVKFIAQNASKLNLEQIFGNEQSTPAAADAPKERVIQAAGDMPVKVHPYIAEEWANMVKHGSPDWGKAMNQGNEEILQRINENDGKLPIADQREMYFKILNHKTNEAEKKGETVVDFVPLKDIMSDLQQWRGEEIRQQYTPTEHIPSLQQQTVAAASKSKSREVEL